MLKYYLFLAAVTICLVSVCTLVRDNPIDEKGTAFISPSIEIDTEKSSITDGDTIHFDSGTIVISGNRPECRLQWKVSGGAWTEWTSGAEAAIHLDSLPDGICTLVVAARYYGGEQQTEREIIFRVGVAGFVPSILPDRDTSLLVDENDTIIFAPAVSGADPLLITWSKNDTILPGATNDTLIIAGFHAADTGTYRCIVVNDYGTRSSGKYLTALRKSAKYRVYYRSNNADRGSVPNDDGFYRPGDSIIASANIGNLFKSGYEFAGWTESPDENSSRYTVGSSIVIDSSDLMLYAWWTKEPTYTVMYDGNNAQRGTVPDDKNRYVAYSTVTVQKNLGGLEKNDSIFDGWSRDALAGGFVYLPGDTIIVGASNLTLFARWSARNRYHQTYLPNGADQGTVPVDDSAYAAGSVATVPGNTGNLVRSGTVFSGWCTDSAGSGNRYMAGDTILIGNSDIRLYARWTTRPTFSVSYNGNSAESGKVPVDANRYEYGIAVTIRPNSGNLTRPEFTFLGWARDSTATIATHLPGASMAMDSANVVLYAIWTTRPTFAVSYLDNGGSGGQPPRDVNNYEAGAEAVILNKGTIVKTGYTFTGWNTQPAGGGTSFQPDSRVTVNNDIVLYAQWRIKKYTVTFRPENGVVPFAQSADSGNLLTIPDEPSRVGYRFSGWFREISAINQWNFTANRVSGDVTLFAGWAVISCRIVFDSRGGDAVPASSVNYGVAVPVPDPEPLRTGYDFGGWFKDSACTTPWVFASDIALADDTIFARWALKTYRITFDSRGGDSVPSLSVNHGAGIAAPVPDPEKTGHTFAGWYRDTSCTDPWNFTADVVTRYDTLFARWNVATYQIVFAPRGGSTVGPVTASHGATITAPATTRTGYTFGGWYRDTAFTSPWNFTSDVVTAADTLYARWSIKTYQISFNTRCDSMIAPVTVDTGAPITAPAISRPGYDFGGWYKDITCTSPWVFATDLVSGHTTLHAKWVVQNKAFTIGTWGNFCQGAVSHTFDDNMNTDPAAVEQTVFDAKGFHITLFAITNTANWTNCRASFAKGHEIASHSVSHTSNASELAPSKQAIRTNVTGENCASYAFPNCATPGDAQVMQYYTAGRNCTGSINPTSPTNFAQINAKMFGAGSCNCPNDAASMNSFADQAANGNGWSVYIHHGVGSQTHNYAVTSLPALSAHLDYLDTSRSKIWVETFGNVARYIRERNTASTSSVAATDTSLTMRVSDSLSDTIFNYPLSIRREIPGDWAGTTVTQNGAPVADTIVTVTTIPYVMFKAVPDGGDVVITKD